MDIGDVMMEPEVEMIQGRSHKLRNADGLQKLNQARKQTLPNGFQKK
jgi:hypothetical protein